MGITHALHRWARQTPDRPAIIEGETTITFAEFRDGVARCAGALKALGVSDGDRVGILSLNSARYLECLSGIVWAGGVLNPVNIRWSPAEMAYSLEDSGTSILLVDDAFLPVVSALKEKCGVLKTVVHLGESTPDGMLSYEELTRTAEPAEDAFRTGSDLAGIFYTGGTTGFPKGVMLSHTNLHMSCYGGLMETNVVRSGEDARALHVAPLFHIAGVGIALMAQLLGTTQVMLPFFDPKATAAAIEKHRITEVFMVPTMLQMVLDHPDFANYDLSSLRMLTYGASPITGTLLDRTLQTLPGAMLVQAYGQTETSPVITVLLDADHRTGDKKKLRSAGQACIHAEVRVVGPDDNELPHGEVGEIVTRGDQVMLGYWNRPEETAYALRNGWMHTGDLGFMDADGYLTVVDRLKDMIVTGAENVYSAEVENALNSHPAVAACAVVGVPDAQWGERVHAVVVLKPGSAVTGEELRAHCKELIAGYKCPRSFEFTEALPMTAAGKIRKNELRERNSG